VNIITLNGPIGLKVPTMIKCDKSVINYENSFQHETDECSSEIAEPLINLEKSVYFKPRLKARSDDDDLRTLHININIVKTFQFQLQCYGRQL
jgi:hypothetical protein